jgi:death-on-curing protein
VPGFFFDVDRYPTAIDKAAAVGWSIITGHVFHDGNKRTGLAVCYTILAMNGYHLPIDQIARDMVLQIANGQISLEDFTAWISSRVEPLAE